MGPYKCPDCGVWWAGFEHRCRIETTTTTGAVQIGGTTTIRCICSFDALGRRIAQTAVCPLHDWHITWQR